MDINKWFDKMIPLSKKRVNNAIEEVIKDCARRNVLHSTIPFKPSIFNGIKAINDEVDNYLKVLSELKLSVTEWRRVSSRLNEFINSTYTEIIEVLKKKNLNVNEYFIEPLKLEYNESKNESYGIVEIKINIQKQIARSRFINGILEVLKIIFSAVVGALIGGFIL